MKLIEYEAKQILKESGVATPDFIVVKVGQDVIEPLVYPVVVKSQVPVGGRGKAGGVRVINNQEELPDALAQISSLEIKGHLPKALLIEPKLAVAREHYLSLLINRETASIQLMVHPRGGVEVEDNASGFSVTDVTLDSIKEIAERVAAVYDDHDVRPITELITKLYSCFIQSDATLIEINPLVKTADGQYVCADAKIELDDAAAFRHPEWHFEDAPGDVNFVTLDDKGDVATIANGAGLAMATVDAVTASGMRPANFLDIGGGANTESVMAAFERIMQYQDIKAIVINIFAGITRCDEVARAIIAARQEITGLPPLFIRLSGTNYQEAHQLLEAERIATLPTLGACLTAAKESIHE